MTRITTFGVLLILVLGVPSAEAFPEAWWSPHDSLETQLVNMLHHASAHIDAAVYELSSRPLAQALERASHRGIHVRVLVDCHEGTPLARPLEKLDVRCVEGRFPDRGVMHNKFVLLDNVSVVTGSFNWTASAEHLNFENLLREDDLSIVNRFSALFETLWSRGRSIRRHSGPQRLERWDRPRHRKTLIGKGVRRLRKRRISRR